MAPHMNLPTPTPTPRHTCAVGAAATSPRGVDRHENRSSRRPNPERSQRQPTVYPRSALRRDVPAYTGQRQAVLSATPSANRMIATHAPSLGAPRNRDPVVHHDGRHFSPIRPRSVRPHVG
jgi:hypothetical protein